MNVSFIVMLSCGTVTIVTIVTPARHTLLKFVSIINWISSEGLDRMELLWREEGLISTVINSRYLQMLVKTLKCCRWWLMVRWGEVTRDLLSWTITRAAPGHRPPPPRDGLSCYQHQPAAASGCWDTHHPLSITHCYYFRCGVHCLDTFSDLQK